MHGGKAELSHGALTGHYKVPGQRCRSSNTKKAAMKNARELLLEFTASSYAFGEYEFTGVPSKTGKTIHQMFFGRLVAEHKGQAVKKGFER